MKQRCGLRYTSGMSAPRLASRVSSFGPTTVNRILSEVREWEGRSGKKAVSLMRGQPDFATPPHIVEALKQSVDRGRTGYPDNRGEPGLREAVAQRLERDYGLRYDPATEILITTGATEGVAAAMQALIQPGSTVLLPEPVYDAYYGPVRLAGGEVRAVSASLEDGRFRIAPGDLDKAVDETTALLLLNCPWNPIGVVFDEGEWAEFGRLVEEHDLMLLSDEIYEAITYDGAIHRNPVALMPSLGPRTLIVNSLSKTYAMTGWRCGYCAGPAEVIDAMFRILQQWSRGPAMFVQDASAVALSGPQDAVQEMREEYRRRRAFAGEALAGIKGVRVLDAEGGFFSIVDVRDWGIPSRDLRQRLLEDYAVVVVEGSAYGEAGEGLLRVSFAGGGPALEQGLERLRQGLEAAGASR